MVTVLPINEFETLLTMKELQHSSNIDFIRNQELKVLIKKMLADKTGIPNPQGFITVVLSDDTSPVSERILDKTNKFNQMLPCPPKPVYLHLSLKTQGLSITDDDLLEAEDMDVTDEQVRQLLHLYFDTADSGVRYLFVTSINVVNIDEVFYDKSLEEEIQRIRSSAQTHDLLFQRISLF